jgi:transitional endoplasmic reticulum ATPase
VADFEGVNEDRLILAMANLASRGIKNLKVNQVEVDRSEPDRLKISLPEKMTLQQAIEILQKMQQDEERVVAPRHEVSDAYPLDALHALHLSLSKIYGWVNAVPTPGFFGSNPPAMIQIHTAVNELKQLTWGRMQLPGWEGGFLDVMIHPGPPPRLILGGQCKQKFTPQFKKITDSITQFLRSASIYKGKAIRVGWEWEREGRDYDPQEHCPKFMDLFKVNPDQLVFSRNTQTQIELGLFAPIERTEMMRKYGESLKRGVLLEGTYGMGKTLTAAVTAKLATEHGWTFLYLDSVHDLARGLHLAAQYTPCVVFVEDIEKAMTRERTETVNQILNLMDGMNTKGLELLTVFTTNNQEEITRAFLRPGRLDFVVHIEPPDAYAAVKLCKMYGGNLLMDDINWDEVGELLAKITPSPAAIHEVVKRAKISAIYRSDPDQFVEKLIATEDLISSAKSLEPQLKMIEEERKKGVTKYALEITPRDFVKPEEQL